MEQWSTKYSINLNCAHASRSITWSREAHSVFWMKNMDCHGVPSTPIAWSTNTISQPVRAKCRDWLHIFHEEYTVCSPDLTAYIREAPKKAEAIYLHASRSATWSREAHSVFWIKNMNCHGVPSAPIAWNANTISQPVRAKCRDWLHIFYEEYTVCSTGPHSLNARSP